MQIDKVKVTIGRTVSSGVKFEFIRVDCGLEAEVTPDDDRKKVRAELKKECMNAVNGIIYKELEKTHG